MADNFHYVIIHACTAISDKYISHYKPCKGTNPRCQDEAKPYRQTAIFRHILWEDNGQPREGLNV